MEAACVDELPQDAQQPGPLRQGAPGQGLGQSHQQAFAEHNDVVKLVLVQRQMRHHGGLEGVRDSTAFHPGKKTSALAVLGQIQATPLLQKEQGYSYSTAGKWQLVVGEWLQITQTGVLTSSGRSQTVSRDEGTSFLKCSPKTGFR